MGWEGERGDVLITLPPTERVVVCTSTVSTASVQSARVPMEKTIEKYSKVLLEPLEPQPMSISLPAEGQEKRGSLQFFAVNVVYDDGSVWCVMRRYSDFVTLQRALGHVVFNGASFPGKTMGKCEGGKLAERRWQLEAWLQRVLEHPYSRLGGAWWYTLSQFVQRGRFVLQERKVAPPRSSVLPGAVVSSPSLPQSDDEEGDLSMVAVVVPAGLEVGGVLSVEVDGRCVDVEVPKGHPRGSELLLWYDADTETLAPVTAL